MKIIKVTPDNINSFNKEIKKPNLIAFVKIYSNSCGHCKAMESDWTQLENELKNELKNEDINGLLASISSEDIDSADCDTDNRGVPTLRVFEGGKRKMDYEGKRTTADMKLFFKNLLKKQKGGRRKNFLKKSSRRKRKTRRRKNFLKKSSRKKRKTRRRKNFLKKSSRKRRKRKTRKRRRKHGGLTETGKLKSDAIIASAMLGSEDHEFKKDTIKLLQDIRSLKVKEEEEGLNVKDLKLMGGRRKTKKRKKRRK